MTASSVWWRTRVGTRIVGRTARTSNSDARRSTRETVAGLAARRSCRAHAARISSFHGMSGLSACCISPVPHVATRGSLDILGRCSMGAREALEHDQRGGAGRMCCGKKRRLCKSAIDCEEDGFTAAEIVKHRRDAVGPLLQRRERARRDRDRTLPCPAGRRRSVDRAMSSPRPTLEATAAPERPRSL